MRESLLQGSEGEEPPFQLLLAPHTPPTASGPESPLWGGANLALLSNALCPLGHSQLGQGTHRAHPKGCPYPTATGLHASLLQ